MQRTLITGVLYLLYFCKEKGFDGIFMIEERALSSICGQIMSLLDTSVIASKNYFHAIIHSHKGQCSFHIPHFMKHCLWLLQLRERKKNGCFYCYCCHSFLLQTEVQWQSHSYYTIYQRKIALEGHIHVTKTFFSHMKLISAHCA